MAVSRSERWVLAPLRHRQFFSLGELNAAIAELVELEQPAVGAAARGQPALAV